MPTVVLRHKVGDFDTWLKGHQDRVNLFSQVGTGFKTFLDADDPKSVVLVLEITDMDKMMSMFNDPNVQAFKTKHTVIDPIVVSMPVAV